MNDKPDREPVVEHDWVGVVTGGGGQGPLKGPRQISVYEPLRVKREN